MRREKFRALIGGEFGGGYGRDVAGLALRSLPSFRRLRMTGRFGWRSATERGCGDTPGACEGRFVLRGLGLAEGRELLHGSAKRESWLTRCCLLRGLPRRSDGLGGALGFTLVLFGDRP